MRRTQTAIVVVLFCAGCSSARDEPATSPARRGTDTTVLRPIVRTWKFDEAELPADFTPCSGAWSIVDDGTARALAQTASDPAAAFNVILGPREDSADVAVAVRMRAATGETDQGGGLVWRARDKDNYYVARFNPLEDNFRVYKVVEGQRKQLGSADVEVGPGWHELRCVMRADAIECALDGSVLLRARDSTFADPGRVGLWTKADACTHFDDLTVGPSL